MGEFTVSFTLESASVPSAPPGPSRVPPGPKATGSERRFIQDIVFYAPATEVLLDRPLELPHFAGQVGSGEDEYGIAMGVP